MYALGGSNTRNVYYSEAIINDFARNVIHPDWIGSFHRLGLGGVLEEDMIGYKFEFESWDHADWPNVVMIELSVNIDAWNSTKAALCVDALVWMLRSMFLNLL